MLAEFVTVTGSYCCGVDPWVGLGSRAGQLLTATGDSKARNTDYYWTGTSHFRHSPRKKQG